LLGVLPPVVAVTVFAVVLAGCSEEPGEPELVSIDVAPLTSTLTIGETQAFTATGTYDDETTRDLTTEVNWESSDPAVAAIAGSGVATAVAEGAAEITASLDDVASDPATITVVLESETSPSPGDLVFNEVLVDGSVEGDANGDGIIDALEDEFIELVSVADHRIDLQGLILYETTLGDALPRHTFGPVMLEPGEAVVVFGGGDAPADVTGAWFFVANAADPGLPFGLALDDGGDTVRVDDDAGTNIATLEYGGATGIDANIDQSINLDPDVTGSAYRPHSEMPGSSGAIFSPGTHADGSAFP